MRVKHPFIIPFVGLKPGSHQFEFLLEESFFKEFEYSEVDNGRFVVSVVLDKRSNMMEMTLSLNGEMTWPCDVCGDTVSVKVTGSDHWIIKFGDHTDDQDDDIWTYGPQEHQIDIRQRLFELVHLSLPMRRAHEEGMCNPSIMKKMKDYRMEEDADTQWIALKNLQMETPLDQLDDTEDWEEDDE
jgi:uncharacterized metal-binding protein YceD (DUF177 family)